jgi:hypothetical protein
MLRLRLALPFGTRQQLNQERLVRVIHLPAIDKVVPLRVYIRAAKIAKANPDRTFATGFTTWWPTTGAEIMDQFRQGVMQRINEAIPYIQRGLTAKGVAA